MLSVEQVDKRLNQRLSLATTTISWLGSGARSGVLWGYRDDSIAPFNNINLRAVLRLAG